MPVQSVFVSSTSIDLKAHRDAVAEAIAELELYPIVMKNFGSRPDDAVYVSLEEVRKADYFVGILAHRYGHVPAGMEKSITEQEYDQALEMDIPILMYLIQEDHILPIPEDKQEDELQKARLKAFKKRVDSSHVRATFTTPEKLAQQVTVDLARIQKKFLQEQAKALPVDKLKNDEITYQSTSLKESLMLSLRKHWRSIGSGLVIFLTLLFAFLALVPEDVRSTWFAPSPIPMPPGFNVIVAGFAYQNSDGTMEVNTEADRVSDFAFASLANAGSIDNIWGWQLSSVPHILDDSAEERRNTAAQLARQLNADVVVYGVVSENDGRDTYQPEFYLDISSLLTDLEPELIVDSFSSFAQPITYIRTLDNPIELQNHFAIFEQFINGLAAYINATDNAGYADSVTAFDNAIQLVEAEDRDGFEVLYIFAGNAAERAFDDIFDTNALDYYSRPLAKNPDYARGLTGRARSLFQLGVGYAVQDNLDFDSTLQLDSSISCYSPDMLLPEEEELLFQLAERCYTEAANSSDFSPSADIDFKVLYHSSLLDYWRSRCSYGNYWDEVQIKLEQALQIYDSSDSDKQLRLTNSAGNVHFVLAMRILALQGDDVEAVQRAIGELESAIELLEATIQDESRRIEAYQNLIVSLNEASLPIDILSFVPCT